MSRKTYPFVEDNISLKSEKNSSLPFLPVSIASVLYPSSIFPEDDNIAAVAANRITRSGGNRGIASVSKRAR